MAHSHDFDPSPGQQALLAAIRQYNLPGCLESTVVGNVPKVLRFICEQVTPEESWALEPDFIPVWTTNHTSCLAYVPSLGKYTYQHVEDFLDGEPSHVFDSFHHVSVWVLSQLINMDSDEDIKAAAAFFGFDAVDEVLECQSDEELLAKYGLDP